MALVAIHTTTQAQSVYENVRVFAPGALDYPPCEPSIAIDPMDPSRMVAGAVLKYAFVSTDSGQTWSSQLLRSKKHGVYGDPCIVADGDGRFHYFHLSDPEGGGWSSARLLDRIVHQHTRRKLTKWTKGAGIGENHPKDQDKEWATYDPINDRLLVTWTQFDEYNNPDSSCESNILLSFSDDHETWSSPVVLSSQPGNCLDNSGTVEGVTTDVDKEGVIHATWSLNGRLYYTRGNIVNGVPVFEKERAVVWQGANWDFDIPGLDRANGMPVLKVDRRAGVDETIFINWADQRNGEDDTDIWLIRSTNGGDTWSKPVRVNDDPPGSHQFFTWMDIDRTTGHLYFVFYDRRHHSDLNTDVYLAISEDGGRSFKNIRISESPFIPPSQGFFGDYNNISVVNGVVRPIWTRYENGVQSIWTAIINR